jgi:hypothetical protein
LLEMSALVLGAARALVIDLIMHNGKICSLIRIRYTHGLAICACERLH